LKRFLIIPALLYILQAGAQPDWKQSLRFDIHVKFNPPEKSLDALMKLQYTNHSPDTLFFTTELFTANNYLKTAIPVFIFLPKIKRDISTGLIFA